MATVASLPVGIASIQNMPLAGYVAGEGNFTRICGFSQLADVAEVLENCNQLGRCAFTRGNTQTLGPSRATCVPVQVDRLSPDDAEGGTAGPPQADSLWRTRPAVELRCPHRTARQASSRVARTLFRFGLCRRVRDCSERCPCREATGGCLGLYGDCSLANARGSVNDSPCRWSSGRRLAAISII